MCLITYPQVILLQFVSLALSTYVVPSVLHVSNQEYTSGLIIK